MALESIIPGPERVVIDMKAADRWSAIEELIDHLTEIALVDAESRDAVLSAVREREDTMSTGVGHGIGIPHAATARIEDVIGAIGISENGIEFDAMDGKPVYLVMLFVVPEARFQEHLDTLAQIARTLTNPELCEALRDAHDPAEVVTILHESA